MAAATAAKLTGVFEGAIPAPLVVVTFVLVGALIGARFQGVSRQEIARASIGGLIATAMTVGIVTLVAWGASLFVDMPFAQIWLGLSPGGLEAMGALGVALGLDTAFIAAHHVSRLLLLTFAIPMVDHAAARKEPSRDADRMIGLGGRDETRFCPLPRPCRHPCPRPRALRPARAGAAYQLRRLGRRQV